MADKFNPAEHDLKESLIALNRVSKTVKGGRIARFAALMVVRRRRFRKQSARESKTQRRIW